MADSRNLDDLELLGENMSNLGDAVSVVIGQCEALHLAAASSAMREASSRIFLAVGYIRAEKGRKENDRREQNTQRLF